MRAIFYIDGFNFYYSRLLRQRQYRWLDIFSLANSLADVGHIVQKVNYYTAFVSGRIDPDAVGKQQAYLAALKTNAGIEVFSGNFTINDKWVKLVHPPRAKPDGHVWNAPPPEFVWASIPQEKGSDVKLGAHLVRDGYVDAYDVAYVLTNDTDLIEPIRIVTEEIGKQVILVPPILPRNPENPVPPKSLKLVATDFRLITDDMLLQCQFPDEVPKGNGKVLTRPVGWVIGEA
ncbi:MAG: NYN domain-containing protein [Hyphomicrobiales bacterium]|nr:NYN domain-containing protein [Hyphomicrobiales bacterium]